MPPPEAALALAREAGANRDVRSWGASVAPGPAAGVPLAAVQPR